MNESKRVAKRQKYAFFPVEFVTESHLPHLICLTDRRHSPGQPGTRLRHGFSIFVGQEGTRGSSHKGIKHPNIEFRFIFKASITVSNPSCTAYNITGATVFEYGFINEYYKVMYTK